ncbi:hypothetical protein C922_02033, partial [Plasmodium inui San Antonio 1]
NHSEKVYHRKDTIVTLGASPRRMLREEAHEHFKHKYPLLMGKIWTLPEGYVRIFRYGLDELKHDDFFRKEFNPFITDCSFAKQLEASEQVGNKEAFDSFDCLSNYYDSFYASKDDYDEPSRKALDDSERNESIESEDGARRQKYINPLGHPS